MWPSCHIIVAWKWAEPWVNPWPSQVACRPFHIHPERDQATMNDFTATVSWHASDLSHGDSKSFQIYSWDALKMVCCDMKQKPIFGCRKIIFSALLCKNCRKTNKLRHSRGRSEAMPGHCWISVTQIGSDKVFVFVDFLQLIPIYSSINYTASVPCVKVHVYVNINSN